MIAFRLDGTQLTLLLERAQLDLSGWGGSQYVGLGLRDGAEKIRARAVRNVSGFPVSYEGQTFRVMVRTGALKGAIESQWPYGSPLQARVFVNGQHVSTRSVGGYNSKPVPVSQYAAAIEYGHGPIDLKKTMMGKTVPFFASRAMDSQGPYAARGLKPIPVGHDMFTSTRLNRQLAAKGKRPMNFQRKGTRTGSAYFIAFRKVGKTGWVIPEAKPRPFMRAALRDGTDDVRKAVGRRLKEGLTAHV